MIVELIVNLITIVIKLLATPFSILPDVPDGLVSAMDYFFNLLFSNLGFLNFFVNIGTLKAVALVAIAIWTLDNSYHFIMWIIRKLPISTD